MYVPNADGKDRSADEIKPKDVLFALRCLERWLVKPADVPPCLMRTPEGKIAIYSDYHCGTHAPAVEHKGVKVEVEYLSIGMVLK